MELWLFSGINPNSIQVSTRKLNTGFYLENHLSPSPTRPLPPPASLFLFLELSLLLRKTDSIQSRGDRGGGLAEVYSKCSLA